MISCHVPQHGRSGDISADDLNLKWYGGSRAAILEPCRPSCMLRISTHVMYVVRSSLDDANVTGPTTLDRKSYSDQLNHHKRGCSLGRVELCPRTAGQEVQVQEEGMLVAYCASLSTEPLWNINQNSVSRRLSYKIQPIGLIDIHIDLPI